MDDDLSQLENLDEKSLLSTLKSRFNSENIYTNCGLMLLSINPYKDLNIYSSSFKKLYKNTIYNINGDSSEEKGIINKGDISTGLKPHIYSLIEDCLIGMKAYGDHSLIISGESGSGKTECTKYILDYLDLKMIKDIDFIIESMGNAKTKYNDNSSRFGKLIKINKKIKYETFLLEKSRITHRKNIRSINGLEKNILFDEIKNLKKETFRETTEEMIDEKTTEEAEESSFHIFYYILSKNEIFIENDFIFNNSFSEKNKSKYFELKKAFEKIGMNFERIEEILLSILYFGSLKLNSENSENFLLKNKEAIKICDTFNLKFDELEENLCKKILIIKNEKIVRNYNSEEFIAIRNSIARQLYSILFDYVISEINLYLEKQEDISLDLFENNYEKDNYEKDNYEKNNCEKDKKTRPTLNILDIFGFEDVGNNGLDQFLINWCNEKIYSEFVDNSFENQKSIFIKEKINISSIEKLRMKRSNLELIERSCGIADLISEESKINGNYSNLSLKIQNFINSDISVFSNKSMEFLHFNGKCKYNLEDFLIKNKEKGNLNLFKTINFREKQTTNDIISVENGNSNSDLIGSKNSMIVNGGLIDSYRSSLTNLFDILNSTKIKYIKCIKSNKNKLPLNFEDNLILKQLKSNGILESINLLKNLYPCCWMYKDVFKERYCNITKLKVEENNYLNNKKKTQENKVDLFNINICDIIPQNSQYKIFEGITRIFFDNKTLKYLENELDKIDLIEKSKLNEKYRKIKNVCKKLYKNQIEKIKKVKDERKRREDEVKKRIKKIEEIKKRKETAEMKNKIEDEKIKEAAEMKKIKETAEMKKIKETAEMKNKIEDEKIKMNENGEIKKIEEIQKINENGEIKKIEEIQKINDKCKTDTNVEDKMFDRNNKSSNKISENKNCDINEKTKLMVDDINTQNIESYENENLYSMPRQSISRELFKNYSDISINSNSSEDYYDLNRNYTNNSYDSQINSLFFDTSYNLGNLSLNDQKCQNCDLLERKYKIQTKELRKLEDLKNEIKHLNYKLLKYESNNDSNYNPDSICESYDEYSSNSEEDEFVENISIYNIFGCLIELFLDYSPIYSLKDIPKEEMLSLAHCLYFLIKRKLKNDIKMADKVKIIINEFSKKVGKLLGLNLGKLPNMKLVLYTFSNILEFKTLIFNQRKKEENDEDNESIINKEDNGDNGVKEFIIDKESKDDFDLLIDTVYKFIITNFKEEIRHYLPYSIIENQSIKNLKIKESIFKKIFTGPSVESLILKLDYFVDLMLFYGICDTIIRRSCEYLILFIDFESFNSLLLKKNFFNFKRCAQIIYNTSEMTKFCTKVGIIEFDRYNNYINNDNKEGPYTNSSVIPYIKEAVKIGMVLSASFIDYKIIEKSFLNSLQINSIVELFPKKYINQTKTFQNNNFNNGEFIKFINEKNKKENNNKSKINKDKFIKEPEIVSLKNLEYERGAKVFVRPLYIPKSSLKNIIKMLL